MNDGKNKVVKNSVLYSVVMAFTKALGLILLPLYTNVKFISTAEYGEYSLLSQFITMATFFVSLSLNNAAIRFYTDFKEDREKVKKFFGTIMTFISLLSLGVLIIFIVFQKPLLNLLFTGIPFFPNVFIILIALIFYTIYTMYQGFLQSMMEGSRYSRNGMLFVLLHAALNVLFLVGFRNVKIGSYELGGLNGMVLSLTISYGVFAIYGVYDLLRKKLMVICIDKKMLSMSIKYSLPLVPHSMANTMAAYIPKVFLNKVDKVAQVAGAMATAIHSVAMQFSSTIDVVQNAINTAQRPWFNEKMGQGEKGKKEIIDFTMVSMRLTIIVCLGVGLFSQEIVLIIARSPAYYEAWKIIPFFAITHAVKSIYYNQALAVMYDLNANKKMFLCSGSGTLLNFVLTGTLVWWVFDLGILGTAISLLVSRILSASLMMMLCRKNKIIMFPLKEMIMCVVLCAITCVVGIVPINWYVISTTGNQITLFSLQCFINFGYKFIVFALGSFAIVGKQRKEFVDFTKSLLKKKRKK